MKQSLNSKTIPESLVSSVKSRFFAQYWGTKTLYIGGVGLVEVGNGGWNLKHPDFFLQLKPLSKITDEDALKCWENDNYNATEEDIKEVSRLFLEMTAVNSDYLRSKGYALPFMGYSVDELVSFGWVQLL